MAEGAVVVVEIRREAVRATRFRCDVGSWTEYRASETELAEAVRGLQADVLVWQRGDARAQELARALGAAEGPARRQGPKPEVVALGLAELGAASLADLLRQLAAAATEQKTMGIRSPELGSTGEPVEGLGGERMTPAAGLQEAVPLGAEAVGAQAAVHGSALGGPPARAAMGRLALLLATRAQRAKAEEGRIRGRGGNPAGRPRPALQVGQPPSVLPPRPAAPPGQGRSEPRA